MDGAVRLHKILADRATRGWGKLTNMDFDLRLMMTAHAAVEVPMGLLFLAGKPVWLFSPWVLAEGPQIAMVLMLRWFGCALLCGGITALLLRDAIPKKSHDTVIYGVALYHALLTAIALGHRNDFSDTFVSFLMPTLHGALAVGFATVAAVGRTRPHARGSSSTPSDRTHVMFSHPTVHARHAPSYAHDTLVSVPQPPHPDIESGGGIASVAANITTGVAYDVGRALDNLDPFLESECDASSSQGSSTYSDGARQVYPVYDTPDKEELPVGRLASCLSDATTLADPSADGAYLSSPDQHPRGSFTALKKMD